MSESLGKDQSQEQEGDGRQRWRPESGSRDSSGLRR